MKLKQAIALVLFRMFDLNPTSKFLPDKYLLPRIDTEWFYIGLTNIKSIRKTKYQSNNSDFKITIRMK